MEIVIKIHSTDDWLQAAEITGLIADNIQEGEREDKPVITTDDLKAQLEKEGQLELPLDDLPPHPAQASGTKTLADARAAKKEREQQNPVTPEDALKAKRSASAKKGRETRKRNAEAKAAKEAAAKGNGHGDGHGMATHTKKEKVDVITPGDEPLPDSPEARKAERKAREGLSKEQRDSIDNPPTYDEVKAAVDIAVSKHNRYDEVLAILEGYEVKRATELDKSQWRMFLNEVEALHG